MKHPVRSGVALLLVLIMLPILTISAVAALSTARSAATASDRSTSFEQARLLVRDLDPLLVEWLASHADTPPMVDDAHEPAIDPSGLRQLYLGGPAPSDSDQPALLVRIEAIDLSGRLHVRHGASFARLGLPAPLLRACEAMTAEPVAAPPSANDAPPPTLERALQAGSALIDDSLAIFPSIKDDPEQHIACLWLTTLGAGELNIHTAPVPLLDAALQGADGGLSAQAIAARRAGEPVPPTVARQLIRDRATRIERLGGGGGLVPLADRSDAFAFLVTVEAGAMHHRWWLTYERRQGDGGETWRPIERRLIAP